MIDIESFTGDTVYLDANFFIYAIEGFEQYAALCGAIQGSIQAMKIHAVTSELALAEVVAPLRLGNKKLAERYEAVIENQFDLKVAPVTRNLLIDAAALRAAAGVKLPDAIHLATAKSYAADFFFTGDKALASRSAVKVVTFDDMLNPLNEF